MRTVGLVLIIGIVFTILVVSWWLFPRAPEKQSASSSSITETGARAADRPAPNPAERAAPTRLRPERSQRLNWFLTGRQSADIPAGKYHLEAILDTRQSEDDDIWKGSARSPRLIITVHPPPAKLTPEQMIDKLQLEAR